MMDTLKRLLEQATARPWGNAGDGRFGRGPWLGGSVDYEGYFGDESDIALIVYLVNTAPKLLELWEAAEKAISDLKEAQEYGEMDEETAGVINGVYHRLRVQVNALKEQELDSDERLQANDG